jgi:hypothetical protein
VNSALLVPSKWMVSREFGTGSIPAEPVVTIEGVRIEQQEGETWGILTFAESWAKPLKVNATSRRALEVMFGTETDNWLKKRIGLYAKPGTFFGERGTAVRIKGSPDLATAKSFQVKRFGGGKDTYELKPMGGAAQAKTAPSTLWWDKLKQVAAEHKVAEDRLKQLTKHTLKRDKISPSEITESDFAEVCTAIAAEASAPQTEPGATG